MASPLEIILGAAESALGVQYKWGGNSLATGVDCSGLVQKAFQAAGISLPRVSADQARVGQAVRGLNDLRPGDLLFWDNSTRNKGADHVAIYIGNGMVIEAYKKGEPIRVAPLATGRRQTPTSIRRVIGVVPQARGVMAPVPLGPNKDRRYTTAAVTPGTNPPAPTAPAPAEVVTTSAARTDAPSGGLGDDLRPNATDAQVEEYIRKHYPTEAAFLGNQEIRDVLFQGAREDWDEGRMQAALQQTNYWKTHPQASRQLDYLLATDFAQAEELITKASIKVDQAYQRAGIKLDGTRIGELAKAYLRGDWNDADLQRQIVHDIRAGEGGADVKAGGEIAATADGLGQYAKEMGVPMSRPALEEWALRITEGTATLESYQSEVTSHARSLWGNDPDVVRAIDEGRTVTQFFDPYRQTIANILGMSPDQIDLFDDPRWSQVTQQFDPGANGGKGGKRAMTLAEVAQFARDQDEYKNTTAYKDTQAQSSLQLSEFFGMVPS